MAERKKKTKKGGIVRMFKTNTTEIKTTVMNALLGDLRILKIFGINRYDNTSQYMGSHIYPFLHGDNDYRYVGTYVYFDVVERDNDYKIIFEIKAHKDISCCVPNNLDKIEVCIKEDMSKTLGIKSARYISSSICRGYYVEKTIDFLLNKSEMSATSK